MFNWNEKYSVGIEEVDNQHKRFFIITEGVLELLNNNIDVKKIKFKGLELLRYSKWHFEAEEFYMTECKFNFSEEHKTEHKEIIAKINYFINDLDKFDTNFGTELIIFLKKWFLNHILKIDQKLYNCVIEANKQDIIIKDTIKF